MGTKFWWNSLKHVGMLVSWTCLHLVLAVNQLCSILREPCSCVCTKITQTAVAVHPSTCRSLNSLAEWGGEQEGQETAMDGLNCIFRHTSLHWGNNRRRGADSRRGVWMYVHKTQLYHTTQGCGGLGGQNSFECHDFGKALPGERDQWFLLLVHRNADPRTV